MTALDAPRPRPLTRIGWVAPRFAVIAGLLVTNGTAFGQVAPNPEAGAPTLVLESDGPAQPGEPVRVKLVVYRASDLAGFQVALSHDPRLRAIGAQLEAGLGRGGRDILPLGPVFGETSVDLGAVTCPIADCGDARPDRAVAHQPIGVSGRVELASVDFFAPAAGRYVLRWDDVRLVDPRGNYLTARGGHAAIEFGPRGHALSTTGFQTFVRGGPSRPAAAQRLDLTRNLAITAADAWSVIAAWRDLRAEGQCTAAGLADRDLSGDGCLDAADAQTILAAWGRPLDAAASSSGADPSPLTLVVTSSRDESDLNPGDGVCRTKAGTCTLRAAVEEANVRVGPETITFDIRNTNGSCPTLVTIQPASAGLTVDDGRGDGMTIDGYSQCNSSANAQAVGGDAVVKIELKGRAKSYIYGIQIFSADVVVRGVAVYNWYRQVYVAGSGAHGNRVEGSFLGTDSSNSFVASSASRAGAFIYAAPGNTVGGATPGARNVIAGNNDDGVVVEGDGADDNRVIGNYIGLKQDGVTALRNNGDGVDIQSGPKYTWIGGPGPGEGNVISGNNSDGVELSHNTGTQFTAIVGNYIGINAAGTAALRNRRMGITLEDGVNSNAIHDNVISGNGSVGVRLYLQANTNDIHHNLIGVAPDGVTPIPNGSDPDATRGRYGVKLEAGSSRNRLADNVIAYGPDHGVFLTGDSGSNATRFNTLTHNRIFDNAGAGIRLSGGSNQGIAAPRIVAANPVWVTGTACANCRIEIFIADKTDPNDPSGDNSGEGKTFVGEGTADAAGNFAVAVVGVADGPLVTGTATDGNGNTSEFGRNVLVVGSPASPTPSPTSTVTATSTFTPTPTLTPTATFTPTPTFTPSATFTPGATATATPPPVDVIYLSLMDAGSVGGISFRDEDVLTYHTGTGAWALYFDGSDVGLASTDVDGFTLLPDGSLLISIYTTDFVLPGLGTVDDSDILRFVPTSLGDATAGTFEMYFDGSDVGLELDVEDVDAIGRLPDSSLLISTLGTLEAGGWSGRDEDLFRFVPAGLGEATSGEWSIYFDGSDVGLIDSTEDVLGVWVNPDGGQIHLTTLGAFSVTGASGDGADIFVCAPASLGEVTACTFGPGVYWDGSAHGLAGQVIDAFTIVR